jgi:hypothetical protein
VSIVSGSARTGKGKNATQFIEGGKANGDSKPWWLKIIFNFIKRVAVVSVGGLQLIVGWLRYSVLL